MTSISFCCLNNEKEKMKSKFSLWKWLCRWFHFLLDIQFELFFHRWFDELHWVALKTTISIQFEKKKRKTNRHRSCSTWWCQSRFIEFVMIKLSIKSDRSKQKIFFKWFFDSIGFILFKFKILIMKFISLFSSSFLVSFGWVIA